eukprot:gnl/Trimastix_PCT/2674.p1 GENE.gnl/Trimastix_PCT/2674~~gnl/Trimastix_PCT/2674.p1  ORF type:complete len:380 (+),score=145.28 gnl/Trimastix_PCT/2674:59-1198(+)
MQHEDNTQNEEPVINVTSYQDSYQSDTSSYVPPVASTPATLVSSPISEPVHTNVAPSAPVPAVAERSTAAPNGNLSTSLVMKKPVHNDLTIAEAALYFFMGLVLNIFGLFFTAYLKRGMIPCLIGFAMSFFCYDVIVLTQCGHPTFALMLISIALIIIIYYRYESTIGQDEIAGTIPDFVFYMFLGMFGSVLGLFFGFFQRRVRAKWASFLGFLVSLMCLGTALIIYAALRMYGNQQLALLIWMPFVILFSLVELVLTCLRMRAEDPEMLAFPFWWAAAMLFGPFGILAAVLHRANKAKYGGLFGLFCWIIIAGFPAFFLVHKAVGIVCWTAGIFLTVAFALVYRERTKHGFMAEPQAYATGIFNPSMDHNPKSCYAAI